MRHWVIGIALVSGLLAGRPRVARADTFYPNAGGEITFVQLSGPSITPLGNGDNQWSTPVQFTNASSMTLNAIVIVNEQIFGSQDATWNNTAQQWQSGSLQATFTNPGSYFLLSDTNIPIPAGFGLTASDSVPAYSLGTLAPGGQVTIDFLQDISPSVNTEFFYIGIGAIPVTPLPSSAWGGLALLGGLGLIPVLRRRWSAAA